MKTVLAIDPGVRVTGWALFADGELIACGLSRFEGPPKAIALACKTHAEQVPEGADHVVAEEMIHYPEPIRPGKKGKARHVRDATAQDLINCATIGAFLSALCGAEFSLVPARTWKGQLPKDVSENRIRNTLTPGEIATMDQCLSEFPKGLRHNGIDSVGQGLHFIGRKKDQNGNR